MKGFIFILLAAGAAGGWNWRRAARLKRWGRKRKARYDPWKSSLVTLQSSQKLELLRHRGILFHHLLTFPRTDVFARLADVSFPATPKTGRAQTRTFTLYAAERLNGQWPMLKVAPLDCPFRSSALPRLEVPDKPGGGNYHFFASSNQALRLFTPYLRSLLAKYEDIYIEISPQAFLYHRHQLLSPSQLDTFLQQAHLLQSQWETLFPAAPPPLAPAPAQPAPAPGDGSLEMRVQALLMQHRPDAATPSPGGGFPFWKILLILLLLCLLPLWVLYIKHFLPH